MSGSTVFHGNFKLNKRLIPEHIFYLKRFSETRRMKRNTFLLQKLSKNTDSIHHRVGLPLGLEGAYFVPDETPKQMDSAHDTVVDPNEPPTGQPGLWCGWTPTNDGTALECNGTNRFYCSCEWLEYIIEHFLNPWGYVLNGNVHWEGEHMIWSSEAEDFVKHFERGVISVKNNVINVFSIQT